MKDFARALEGGDRRSIGQADQVVEAVTRNPNRFGELWACLKNSNALVRMRGSDALEKYCRINATPFAEHKKALLTQELNDGSPEVRWHLVAIASQLLLSERELKKFYRYLGDRLRSDPSKIVKVMSLQAASDLSAKHPEMKPTFQQMLAFARASPWPSLISRAKKLAAKR